MAALRGAATPTGVGRGPVAVPEAFARRAKASSSFAGQGARRIRFICPSAETSFASWVCNHSCNKSKIRDQMKIGAYTCPPHVILSSSLLPVSPCAAQFTVWRPTSPEAVRGRRAASPRCSAVGGIAKLSTPLSPSGQRLSFLSISSFSSRARTSSNSSLPPAKSPTSAPPSSNHR